MTDKTQIKVIVTGRVQGVFYRASTKEAADRIGIKGYVKNLPNGAVEAFFEGEDSRVAKMVEWCHKGPGAADVDQVLVKRTETVKSFETFEVRY